MVFVVYNTTIFLAKKLVVPSTILGQYTLSQTLGANDDASTNNLQTASYIKNIEDNNWTKSYNYFDSKGRLISTNRMNHLGGYTKTESELDLVGVPQKTNTYHLRKQGEAGVTVKERFVYDDQNRLLKQYHHPAGASISLVSLIIKNPRKYFLGFFYVFTFYRNLLYLIDES